MRPDFDQYEGKEQAWVKHWLLEKYLERLILKVARRWKRLVFIDAFAGPWKANSDDLSDTSFSRAIEVMRRCREALDKLGVDVPLQAYFLEKRRDRANRLIQFANSQSSDAVQVEAFHLDFVTHVGTMASRLRDDDFAFVLIDPTGYKDVIAPDVLQPLLKKRGVELLINLMWDPLNRFKGKADHAAIMQQIFGDEYTRILSAPSGRAEEEACQMYCARLRSKRTGARVWAKTFQVKYPYRDRTYYRLVYATHSSIGLLTFDDIAQKASNEQARARATVTIDRAAERRGMGDLFGVGESLPELPQVEMAHLCEAWLRLLPIAGSEITIDEDRMADLIEQYTCSQHELQQALAELTAAGTVENVSARRKRTSRSVHPEKRETLRRVK